MVSRKGRDAVVQHALLPSDSPLEKTPHNACNGELSITCANRHCPKCQSLARAQWLEDRQAELLNTEYFHVVFTVPEQIASISYQNKRELYGILFRAAAETLRTIAADPKHLGAEIGLFTVLQPASSSPPTLCGHRRWSLCGWHGVGFLPSWIFLARPGPLPAVSSSIPGISDQSL